MQEALDGLEPGLQAPIESFLDVIDALKERLADLEGDNGSVFVESFREELVGVSSSTLASLGLTNIRETYFLAKLVNSVPSENWEQNVPDLDRGLHVSSLTEDLKYWDKHGAKVVVFATLNSTTPRRSLAFFSVPSLDGGYIDSDKEVEIDGFGLNGANEIKTRIISLLLKYEGRIDSMNLIVCSHRQKKYR